MNLHGAMTTKLYKFLLRHEKSCNYINIQTGEVTGLLRLIVIILTSSASYESLPNWMTIKKFEALENRA